MKKILMTTLMGIGLLGVQEAFAISEPDGDNRNMPVTTDAPAASHANLHTLPTVRVVQEALLSVSRTIKDVLARAEHLGFNTLGTAPLYMYYSGCYHPCDWCEQWSNYIYVKAK